MINFMPNIDGNEVQYHTTSGKRIITKNRVSADNDEERQLYKLIANLNCIAWCLTPKLVN